MTAIWTVVFTELGEAGDVTLYDSFDQAWAAFCEDYRDITSEAMASALARELFDVATRHSHAVIWPTEDISLTLTKAYPQGIRKE